MNWLKYKCRLMMKDFYEIYSVYANWKNGGEIIYPIYQEFFEKKNYLFDFNLFYEGGFYQFLYH